MFDFFIIYDIIYVERYFCKKGAYTVKRILALLLAFVLLFSVCACDTGEPDYSDGDGNSELISLENKKVSRDDIEFNVVSIEEERDNNLIKRYKSVYAKEDFTVKIEKVKAANGAYVTDEDTVPQYPEKTVLPQYDLAALKAVMLELYAAKAKDALPQDAFVSEPKFAVKSFTGKLVVMYNVYFEPTVDEMGVTCYKSAKRVKLTGNLYTYEVE